MTITVYVYTKCSTCQKALRFLEQNKISFIRKEITETPPSPKELQQMLKYMGGDMKKLFNTSGILYRELQLSEKLKEMSLDKALDLLSHNGMLVKRPFLLSDNQGLVGFREPQWLSLRK
jgi:arsenate reductase